MVWVVDIHTQEKPKPADFYMVNIMSADIQVYIISTHDIHLVCIEYSISHTHWVIVTPGGIVDLVNIGWGNDLFPDISEPLPQALLINFTDETHRTIAGFNVSTPLTHIQCAAVRNLSVFSKILTKYIP